jgi:transcriptional regulator with XRE-family HTH domain
MMPEGDFRQSYERFKSTPESYAITLQTSLTRLVLESLKDRGWTQRDLAKRANIKEPFLTRTLQGDNWTTATAGKLLCALGVRAEIARKNTSTIPLRFAEHAPKTTYSRKHSVKFYGQEEKSNTKEIRVSQ